MGSPFRALLRAIAYLAWTALLLPAQAIAVALGLPLARRIPLFYHRHCARILGLNVEVRGTMSSAHPTLFVANHCSYLDITVFGSIIPGSFVAKAEVASWPLFGLLAKLQRSVFVDRRGPKAGAQRDEIVRRLEAGDWLILFPEGTSHDGNRVLPFKSALFAVAEIDVRGVPLVVQPVSIAYVSLDGIPIGRSLRPCFAWYGEMGMMSHAWEFLGLGRATVVVHFHDPVTIAAYGSRKALAQHCWGRVAAGLAAANSGRAVPPVAASKAAAAAAPGAAPAAAPGE
ncbi:MAG: 1-acyl-sn-glycerol-3-phosphate acyltransferase [Alphaproteobacteria bacterium]|nr:1-acyl-sn-glycerol-3-phosphate acyltransferase [Alphaproteobacteria bacterium]